MAELTYFQLRIIRGVGLKIGVARPGCDMDSAFCDEVNGWGLFDGALRHGKEMPRPYGAKINGVHEGSRLDDGDVVGVLVDRIDGRLTYYKNGHSLGLAFEDP